MLEIWYVALPSSPLQSCSNEGPRFQDGPAAGGPRFKLEINRKIFKNLLLQNVWLRCLKFGIKALPFGPLSSLSK